MTLRSEPNPQTETGDAVHDLKGVKSINWVPVAEQPVYKPRQLRVVCVGAGYSGLMLAYKWKYQMAMSEFLDLTIYEKNSDVGGTWLENRYPGVACDVSASRNRTKDLH